MTEARRGELWLIDLGEPLRHEQGGLRPGLVVSHGGWNQHGPTVTVLPLTRTQYRLPTRVEIEPDPHNGLRETSYARCEDIRSVSDRRLVRRLGEVDAFVMFAIAGTIRRFLDV
ncbi:type II toxin-antitoxin system PemK/MazF family toxin [soil metagenome]